MSLSRKDFLNTAWMGAAALAAGGCVTKTGASAGGSMATYADKPLTDLRVGVIGLGRGFTAICNFTLVPGSRITAICDIHAGRRAQALKWLAERKAVTPKVYGETSDEDWKRLCEDPNIDLIYNATPFDLHVPIALYAMKCGKHVATEVPAAFTVEDCWELVETSEKTRRHCIQLENCCYGEIEMLAYNLVHQGVLGEITHGEGAYIHELREFHYSTGADGVKGGCYPPYWRLKHFSSHLGNQYPTHGLCPILTCMDINRGDRLDCLVSMDSKQAAFDEYAKAYYKDDPFLGNLKVRCGDINTSLIRTVKGRTIILQNNVATARPYTRRTLLQGTRGILQDFPLRIAAEPSLGKGVGEFDEKTTQEWREKYQHPLWKTAGKIAEQVGGHGGMDFLMTLRLSFCLQNGLPVDMNVYDLACTSCLCELSEKSSANRYRTMDVPDFTRGAWKTTKPLGLVTVDLKKMGLDPNDEKLKNGVDKNDVRFRI